MRLLGMCTGPDFKIDIWVRNVELLEELLAHADIVVLSGMHENVLHLGIRLKCTTKRRNLHEIRARPYY